MPTSEMIRPSFVSGEISPRMGGRVDMEQYGQGCSRLENALVHPQGGVTRRSGLRFICEVGINGRKSRLIPFIFSTVQAYVLEFGHQFIRFYKDGGIITTDGTTPYQVATAYTEAELSDIQYTQSADVLYIVHPNHPPRMLTRTGHTAWTLTNMTFGAFLDPPANVQASLIGGGTGTKTHAYVVTTVSSVYDESPASAEVTVAGPKLDDTNYVSIGWDGVTGAKEYRVYKRYNGVLSFIGTAWTVEKQYDVPPGVNPPSPTNPMGVFIDRGEFKPNPELTPPEYPSLFSGIGSYPTSVCFFQQRLCFAGSADNPQGLWLSRTGAFKNFNKSYPPRDDDGLELMVDSDQVNAIQWLMPGQVLLFGTRGGEWRMSGANGGPVTPASFSIKRDTHFGSEPIRPAQTGDAVVYLERGGKKCRQIVYSLEANGYQSIDLSIMAEHLTRNNRITGWAYQSNPDPVLWCVRDDGVLLGLTLHREHKVIAWHRHTTQGLVESVACIPGAAHDEVWVTVHRWVNGVERRFVERLDGPFYGVDGAPPQDGFFVDCGLSYSGGPISTLSGLNHLENMTVQVLADGAVHPPVTVINGQISLQAPASVVHAGLPYDTVVELLPIETQTSRLHTIQGRKKRITHLTLRLERTLGGLVGPDDDNLDMISFRTSAVPLGEGPGVFTGDTEAIPFPSGYDREGAIVIKQDQPLPLTVLAVIPRLEVPE